MLISRSTPSLPCCLCNTQGIIPRQGYALYIHPSLELGWLRGTLRLYNQLAYAPAHSLHGAVVRADWEDACVHNIKNWAWGLREYLRQLGWALPRDGTVLPELDARAIMDAATAREQACWQGLSECPRTCPTAGASLCKYARWFAPRPGPRLGSNPYVTLNIGLSRVLQIIKFRLGCHRLPIVALRNTNVPRAQRLCVKCASGALGDEQHLPFDCHFVACVRAQSAHLFTPGCTMLEFMQQRDIRGVACFIIACLKMYLAPTVPNVP